MAEISGEWLVEMEEKIVSPKIGGKTFFVLCLLVKNLSAVYSADRCDF